MPDELRVLVLEGPPRERGRVHGETLRPMIQEHIERWKDALQQEMGLDPETYLEGFFEETDFVPAIERWAPELLSEVRGIAEGAGIDFKYVLIRQLSDEEPWYRFERKIQAGDRFVDRIRAQISGENCSALGVQAQGDRPPIIAQNMDTPAYYDGHQVLLHIKDPSSPVDALVFTVAGKISLAGLSNQGIGICCNTLIQLDFAPDGLPEDFCVRGFLSRPTFEGALAFLRGVKHASGQNYVAGGPGGVLDLECSATSICEFQPYPGANRVYHTNHPLANKDQTLHKKRLDRMPPDIQQWYRSRQTTYKRFNALEKGLSDPDQVIDVEAIKSVLGSHDGPVCVDRGGSNNITLGCLIMELSTPPVLHLAPGPPCSTSFKTYTFEGG
jgi:hypothetical protein